MIVNEELYQQRLNNNNDIANFMPHLREAAGLYPQGRIAELGVRTGNSTVALLMGLAPGATLHSVDIDPQPPLEHPNWKFLQADDMSQRAQSWIPRHLDVLFIDSSHLYDHVLGELTAYGPRVRKGGLILCHDTGLDSRDVPWLQLPVEPKLPVRAALEMWCKATNHEFDDLTGGFGLGIVRI